MTNTAKLSRIARPKSQAAFERAFKLIPGGVNSPARAFGGVGGHPLFIARAKDQYLFDIDGNQYLDYIGSWGPMILGHAHPQVIDAIQRAAANGTSYGAPTERESELAELIIASVPSVEKVRFVSSGTEATMSAIRLARGATGRDKIIKFAGNYHGHVDSLLVAAGSAAATLGVPDSPGVTRGNSQDTIVLEYNDLAAVQRAFEEIGSQIAAVILEPVVGNMGLVIPKPGFLQGLRDVTAKFNAVLIFDEVMTGFRLSLGGAQQLYGITPDLTTMGKIVGGGLPLGAFGGRADLMDQVLPAGKVFQAGTLSGNPLATAAGATVLRILRDAPPYEYLEEQSGRLAEGFASAAEAAGIEHQVQRVGSMLTLFFNDQPIQDWPSADRSQRQSYSKFFWGMMDRGVYLPCSQFEAMFLSRAHTPENIDETIDAAKETLLELR
jgi:glutamate-1-semialdehyde 2,1-aminomutase